MQDTITPIQHPRRPMKGVASGIPEAIKVRSLDHVRPAFVMDKMNLNSGCLVHEMDKHGRHHRITFRRPVDGQSVSSKWEDIRKGVLFVHLGRTYIAYNRQFFEGRILDADILASKLQTNIKTLVKASR